MAAVEWVVTLIVLFAIMGLASLLKYEASNRWNRSKK